ncbi:MAG: TrbI/VirB10 family protein [Sphingomonadales bacterium]|nr:TrbI/VirB10 family protein [Sphingomonadales bacterium]
MSDPLPNSEADPRPLVARPVRNTGVWLFAGVMALLAAGLFTSLESRRNAAPQPGAIPLQTGQGGMIAAPPALAIPDTGPLDYGTDRPTLSQLRGLPGAGGYMPPGSGRPRVPDMSPPRALPGVPTSPRVIQPGYYPGPPIVPPAAPATFASAGDGAADSGPGGSASPAPRLAGSRVSATRFANPATTVPQGAIIQAVLETALDSNRPGFARAIIARDVRGFDGSQVLIPRGSRLFGEYRADLAPGQNRAFIQWQKLTRPDGVQIALESPAADPLGQAGVKGKVNSHFFPRFGAAILQSALDIGVGLATRSATNGTVVLGLPGSTQSITVPGNEPVRPTLKIRQGTSVSVFVARDLDFTTVER